MQYRFYSDPSHAWLAVKRTELIRLGIINKISSCSYEKGGTVYLEEDDDARKFVETKKALNEKITVKEIYHDNTPIRYYQSFSI